MMLWVKSLKAQVSLAVHDRLEQSWLLQSEVNTACGSELSGNGSLVINANIVSLAGWPETTSRMVLT